MPTITPRSLIYDAYRSLGVLRPGQQTSDDAVDDAFRALNELLDSWMNERLMIYAEERTAYPLVGGTASYTLGFDAAAMVTGTLGPTRPHRVEAAALVRGSSETPIKVLSFDQWRLFASGVYIDGAYPIANVNVNPAPTGGESLVLYAWNQLPQFAHADAVVNLPAGYQKALRWNLALDLAAGASIQAKIANVLYAHIERQAADSKGWVKSFHSTPPPTVDASDGGALGCGCGGSYNIYSDGY